MHFSNTVLNVVISEFVWNGIELGSGASVYTDSFHSFKGHKVLSIVPANAATRVVGWVELDAVGIPEADLKRDKKAYITPTPVKK